MVTDYLFGISIILMILTGAAVCIAATLLCIFIVLLKGVNQHISALQGIYDEISSRKVA